MRPEFGARNAGLARLTAVDEVLSGGMMNSGAVFRRGEIVHRPAQAHALAIHCFLAALPEYGFSGAPRPVSLDDGTTLWVPINHPCCSSGMFVFVEGAAEAVASSYVQVDDLCGLGDRLRVRA